MIWSETDEKLPGHCGWNVYAWLDVISCDFITRPFYALLMSALGRKRTLARLGNERPLTGTGLKPGNDRMGAKRPVGECPLWVAIGCSAVDEWSSAFGVELEAHK